MCALTINQKESELPFLLALNCKTPKCNQWRLVKRISLIIAFLDKKLKFGDRTDDASDYVGIKLICCQPHSIACWGYCRLILIFSGYCEEMRAKIVLLILISTMNLMVCRNVNKQAGVSRSDVFSLAIELLGKNLYLLQAAYVQLSIIPMLRMTNFISFIKLN